MGEVIELPKRVKLVESTVFKDPTREPLISEKTFSSLAALIRVLKHSPLDNNVRYQLTKNKECYLTHVDARTTLKIIEVEDSNDSSPRDHSPIIQSP